MMIKLKGLFFCSLFICKPFIFVSHQPFSANTLPYDVSGKLPLENTQSLKPDLNFYTLTSENFPSDARYMIRLLHEYILETFLVQKKIYIPHLKKFVGFRLRKKPLKNRGVYQKLIQNLVSVKQKKITDQFELLVDFYYKNGKKWLNVTYVSPEGGTFKKKYLLTVRRIKKIQSQIRKQIQDSLCWKHCYKFFLTTSPQKVSVYIDQVYWGVSPIQIRLPADEYEFQFLKDSYKKHQEKIQLSRDLKKYISLKKTNTHSTLFIQTQPSGANVYFDAVYQGKTPLTLQNLSQGHHILKLTKDGFQPEEKAVLIEDAANRKLNIPLVSSVKYRSSKRSFWSSLTYEDFYIASFIPSAVFFSAGIYFSVESSSTREKLLVSLDGIAEQDYTQEDLNLIEISTQKAQQEENISISFYALGSLFFILGAYFVIKDLIQQDIFSNNHFFFSFPFFKTSNELTERQWSMRYVHQF